MKLKRLAALVLAVMMTLAAASVTGLSKLAAEGTQKPEKSVVDAAGATWYHADAGEELRFDDDSSYCFESESWIMRQKSGNTIDEAVFDGITPDNVQTLTDENGETYTVSMYSQATVVAALNRMLGKETKKPERTLVERYKIDDEGMIDVIIKLSGDAVLENGGAVLGEGLTKQQSAAREKLAAEHEIIKKRIECAASAISFEYDFTLLCNGFAASVPFNEVSRIAAVAGVESVEYMPVFEIPTESYEIVRPGDTKMTIANDVIESRYAWDLGIDGSGMVIAIIDTGIDTDNECFAPGLETVKLTQEDISRIIAENPDMNMLALRPGTTAEQVYINDKIPFAFDYADKDCDVNHGGQASAHGTHVAGIAAGQAVDQRVQPHRFHLLQFGVSLIPRHHLHGGAHLLKDALRAAKVGQQRLACAPAERRRALQPQPALFFPCVGLHLVTCSSILHPAYGTEWPRPWPGRIYRLPRADRRCCGPP